MLTRDEELMIAEAELQEERKRVREVEEENARLKGQNALVIKHAEAGGLAIDDAEINERGELEVLRQGVDEDLEALNELRNPTGALLRQERTERPIDIVRANQRERAELQERTATANTLLSRLASIVKLDRWDERGGEALQERVQRLAHVKLKTEQRLKERKSKLNVDNGEDHAFVRGEIAALEFVLAQMKETLAMPVDPTQPRRIVFVVGGHDLAIYCKPDDTVAKIREDALGVFYQGQVARVLPADQWLIFDEHGKPLPVDKHVRELALPTDRIVITMPSGAG